MISDMLIRTDKPTDIHDMVERMSGNLKNPSQEAIRTYVELAKLRVARFHKWLLIPNVNYN